MKGILYLVATPIGNLEDITLRAHRILREVDVVASEDTRRTGRLLAHHKIPKKKLMPFHDANKRQALPKLIALLQGGTTIALVSDAGTPGISDPAFTLVRAAIADEIDIVPIPGASALLAALPPSGLPTDQFRFVGFLPKKKGQRRNLLEALGKEEATVVCFESVHRIASTLTMMAEVIPEHNVVIARELTKMHEEFIRGSAQGIYLSTKDKNWKGEIVILFHASK